MKRIRLNRAGRKAVRPFVVLATIVAVTVDVHAQDAASQNSDAAAAQGENESEDKLSLETVVVTGSSVSRTKLDSPLAISTIELAQIQELAPRSTAEMMKVIPGFYLESTAGETLNNLTVRNVALAGAYTYVALQEDGLPVVSQSTLRHGVADQWTRVTNWISNVEALRGGSSGVFTSNATLATVNYISREGGDRFEGANKLEVGDYGLLRNEFWFSGPAGENNSYAIGGFYRVDDGLRDPGFTANQGGQVVANFKHAFASGQGYLKVSGKYLDDRNSFMSPFPLANQADPQSIPFGPDMMESDIASVDIKRMVLPNSPIGPISWDLSDGVHSEVKYVGTEFDFELSEGLRLKNLNRYTDVYREFNTIFAQLPRTWQAQANAIATSANAAGQFAAALIPGTANYRFRLTYPGQNGAVAAADPAEAAVLGNGLGMVKQFAHAGGPIENFQNDLRLIATFNDENTSVTGGLYYSSLNNEYFANYNNFLTDVTDNTRRVDITYLDAAGNAIGQGTFNGISQAGAVYRNDTSEEREIAPYIVIEHKMGALTMDAGYRYQDLHLLAEFAQRTAFDINEPGGTNPALRNALFGTGNLTNFEEDISDHAVTAGLNYTFTPHFASFVRYSRGPRMPSSTDLLETVNAGRTQADPTAHVTQYELGVKYGTRDLGLFLTAYRVELTDVFFNDLIFLPDGSTVPQASTRDFDVNGLELESVWSPLRGLNIGFNGTYGKAKNSSSNRVRATDAQGNPVIVELKGKVPRRTPKFAGTATVSYQFPEMSIGLFSVNGAYQYTGKRFADDANTEPTPLEGYGEATLGLTLERERTLLHLSVNNVFDDEGLSEGDPRTSQTFLDPSSAYFNARPIFGRSITGSFTYRF